MNVILSSKQRTNSSSDPGYSRIDLGNQVNVPLSTIHLKQFAIQNSSYTVPTGKTLSFVSSSVTYSVNLTPGSYNANSWASVLQSDLNTNSAGITFTVSYSSTTFKYSIGSSGTITFLFTQLDNKLSRILGFSKTNLTGTTLISDKCAIVSPTRKYYISIDNQIPNVLSQYQCSFCIINDCEVGGLLSNISGVVDTIKIAHFQPSGFSFQQINIKFIDEDGETVNFNGCDWLLNLHFE